MTNKNSHNNKLQKLVDEKGLLGRKYFYLNFSPIRQSMKQKETNKYVCERAFYEFFSK